MTNLLSKILFERARKTKIALQVLVDTGLLLFCFWLAMALRLDGITTHISYNSWLTMGSVVPSTILAFYGLGLYRSFVRFMNEKGIKAN